MANTRTATKRARQAIRRNARNQSVRSAAKTAVRAAVEAVAGKDAAKAKDAYQNAIRVLGKAASKGVIPKTRAARKMSRLTLMVKKTIPAALTN